jgi:hypothetical protein
MAHGGNSRSIRVQYEKGLETINVHGRDNFKEVRIITDGIKRNQVVKFILGGSWKRRHGFSPQC